MIQWRQIFLKMGGGQTYICVTSVRAQRALIPVGGPRGGGGGYVVLSAPSIFSDLVVSEGLSDKF